MKKKTVSETIVTLLLINILALSFCIQLAMGDLKTSKGEKSLSVDDGTNRNKKETSQESIVVEHKITAPELERLRRIVGVAEKGRNYNQIIDGHGTGLRPPTEKEWAEIADKTYVVEKIPLNQTTGSPSSIDHTIEPWFPPIGDQDGEGSCVAWAVGYYTKTFQEAKEHGWNLSDAEWVGGYFGHPTEAYQDRIFSPDFIYHQINGGEDHGSYYSDAISLVCSIGVCSWKKMPYNPNDWTSWPSEDAWREAPLYRGNSSGIEYMELATDDDLMNLKNWIASDHLATISLDADQYSSLTSEDLWTLDNYVNPSTNHANTIAGYDDDMKYWEQGKWRYGAFKIANSWGVGGWENIPDGCYWISYEAMKQRFGYCMFYRDRIGYDPTLMVSFKVDHSKRGECDITFGIGNKSAPIQTKEFDDWILDGGNHPFCPNNIVLDITEFEEAVPTVINQPFFIKVYDGGIPSAYSGVHEWCSDGVSYSWFRLGQAFDIPATGATLKFWTYYEIEEDWDYGYVEVHDLNTSEWYTPPGLTTVSTLPGRQNNPNCPSEFEPTAYYDAGRWNAFTGFSRVWYQEEMNLTLFGNHTIELYFTYWTDPYLQELGWYIDDIEIPEIGFFDDVESGYGNWTYNGWSITAPSPSSTGTILSFSIENYESYISRSLEGNSTSHDVPMDTMNQHYVFAELTLKIVWTVDDDGPADFHTMQEAINKVNDGNTIFVYSGTYYENVVLNKTLSLVGENRKTTFIDGNHTDNVVTITANNAKLTGFTIQKGGLCFGIYLYLSSNSIVCGNNITNNEWGIVLAASYNNTISENIISNNGVTGIRLFESLNNSIYENDITNNDYGITVRNSSDNNVLSRNNIRNNYIVGIRLGETSRYNTIVGNNITANYYGIIARNCSNNILNGNSIRDSEYGMTFSDSSDNYIFHNNFMNNTLQVNIETSGHANFWNDDYPSGGNYWSDYNGTDSYRGPHQNETGRDGIGDTPYVIDANNTDNYPLMKLHGALHDIGITSVTTAKTVVSQGYNLTITIEIQNYGLDMEIFSLTVYADTTAIQTITDVVLPSRNFTTITFIWNTASFAKGNYTISAYAWPVPGEIDTVDNKYTDGLITIAMAGDLNDDNIVDVFDIVIVAAEFGRPPPPIRDLRADVNNDGTVDVFDIVIVAAYFGQVEP